MIQLLFSSSFFSSLEVWNFKKNRELHILQKVLDET